MKTYLTLAVLLMGCGHDFEYVTQARCLTFYSPNYLNQAVVEANVELAMAILVPVVGNDFCSEFDGVPVRILKQREWMSSENKMSAGNYDLFKGIVDNDRMDSLVHELLHAWETTHFRDSSSHAGWNTNGYEAMSKDYFHRRNPAIWRTVKP